jgi:hypothetical protein
MNNVVRSAQSSAAGPKTIKEEGMTQFLVAIHLPDDFDPSVQDKAMERDIDALNEEMEAKGVRLFAGGMRPASEAKSLRIQPDRKVLITDGPYLETKEHVGGFWILEVADLDEALAWAHKAVVACRAPVEVRSFFRSDATGLLARRPLKEGMTQYLTTIQLPDDFDPSAQDKQMELDIDVLNEEMEAKRVRLFAGGLRPAREAKSLRAQPDGKVLMTDGPFLETKEHVGGFWILEVADMDEALAWARKAVVACRAPVEVRALFPSDLTALLARKALKEGMTQYLAAGHLPENFDPSSVSEAMMHDMGALNEEMEAKGVTIFAGGLHPATDAKSLRAQPGGKVLITDGPYLETKEHVGGLTILEAADMDEALAWARKGAVAGRGACEVRAFFRSNVPSE